MFVDSPGKVAEESIDGNTHGIKLVFRSGCFKAMEKAAEKNSMLAELLQP